MTSTRVHSNNRNSNLSNRGLLGSSHNVNPSQTLSKTSRLSKNFSNKIGSKLSNYQTTLNQKPSQDELLQLMHQAQLHESSTAQGSAAIFKKRPKTKAAELTNTTPIITVDYNQFSKLTRDLL